MPENKQEELGRLVGFGSHAPTHSPQLTDSKNEQNVYSDPIARLCVQPCTRPQRLHPKQEETNNLQVRAPGLPPQGGRLKNVTRIAFSQAGTGSSGTPKPSNPQSANIISQTAPNGSDEVLAQASICGSELGHALRSSPRTCSGVSSCGVDLIPFATRPNCAYRPQASLGSLPVSILTRMRMLSDASFQSFEVGGLRI